MAIKDRLRALLALWSLVEFLFVVALALVFTVAALIGIGSRMLGGMGDDHGATGPSGAAAGVAADQPGDCVGWMPEVVELRGRLVVSPRSGPPGYGEAPEEDEKLNVPFLELERAITLCPDPDGNGPGGTKETAQVQMNFAYLRGLPRALVGRRVVVRGSLYPAVWGSHFADAVMMVEEARSAGDEGGGDSPAVDAHDAG